MPATVEAPLKIGDVARLVGTTTRTIRYYEEIGLLAAAADRPAGGHRAYGEADVERLREILRLKDLLGVSLDQLRELIAAEDARAAIRAEYRRTDDPGRRRELLEQALGHLERQLDLVRARRSELDALESELGERRERVRRRLEEVQP
ncbi:MAG: MerR family transcriptional regulator, repressor of the yfmOP operon [Solirubrobacteraceae bacterium]|jgi:DNA-binding transcriptional MerR regulator|nr:MerR family transcriptional regulator, repressor of the yfmOP operon [Solirubrobacteraceae bacterium]